MPKQKIRTFLNSAFVTMTVATLAIISAAIEIDIFVPSLPAVQNYFNTTESIVQMLLTINFVGLAISSLLYGPLSDSFGRRKVMLYGLGIFTLGAMGCVFTNSLGWLIFWRFWQGFGSSVAFVVPGAMIYDLYTKEKAAGMLGTLNSIITCTMSGAPMLGAYLYLQYDWHANFLLVGIIALIAWIATVLFCKETLDNQKKQEFNLKEIFSSYKKLITSKSAQSKALILCLVITGYLVYIANLSLIFVNYLHVSENIFPYYQGSILAIFALTSLLCNRAIKKFGMINIKKYGTLFNLTGAILLLVISIIWPNPILITLAMAIYTMGFALMIGIIFGDYMDVFPNIKGAASALCNAQRMIIMSIFIALSGYFFNGTMIPVAIIVTLFSIVSSWLILSSE